MKFFLRLTSIILLLVFTGCGSSGSSKEAKELQRKILKVVGIPDNIVANLCQDGNENGFCESTELQAKISFSSGDSTKDIWNKISQTAEGKYFLETYDATKPLLLVLKDSTVKFDNGEFTLNFNGFKTNKQNEIKELSILESMVDANNIQSKDLIAIKKLNNPKAQEKFYNVLLKDLETNINTLRTKGLDSKNSMNANIKEMADELLTNGVANELPNKINACGEKESCFNQEIDKLSNELLITESEADEILNIQDSINQAPTVNGGEDRNAKVNEAIKLIGKAKDSDGFISTYEWKEGDTVLATTASFEYRATTIGKHTLTLTVVDDGGKVSIDTVIITIVEEVNNNNHGKRLDKIIEYNDSNVQTLESQFFYENDKLVKITNEADDVNDTFTTILKYETDKTIITYNGANLSMSWETLYKNNVMTTWNLYLTNELVDSENILKHDDENRPLQIESKLYDEEEESLESINTYTYEGNYLTRYQTIDQDPESYNLSEVDEYKYDKSYDCISFTDLIYAKRIFTLGDDGENNECINWTSKHTLKERKNQEYTESQKITYDGKLPIRIDKYLYDNQSQKNKHTYFIYKYIN